MQRRDLARSVVRDSSSFFAPHFARTSCVNPLLLRRACRSVDHRAYQTNSRGFVKHTRSFKVNIGRLIWKSMTTMTGYIRRASFSELSAVHLSELLLSGKRLDDDDDRDKKQLRFRKRRYTKSFTRTLTKTYSRHISFAFLNPCRARKSLAPATISFEPLKSRAAFFRS